MAIVVGAVALIGLAAVIVFAPGDAPIWTRALAGAGLAIVAVLFGARVSQTLSR